MKRFSNKSLMFTINISVNLDHPAQQSLIAVLEKLGTEDFICPRMVTPGFNYSFW